MGKILVVQQVHTVWTKDSRGGAGAVRRNAVPESAKIPVQHIDGKELRVVHHRLTYLERTSYRPYQSIGVNPTLQLQHVGCVAIQQVGDVLRATFRYERGCAGAPDRGWVRKTLCLAENQWGQIAYNGRFTPAWDGDGWYEKMVVNVGLFERLTSGLFTREAPASRFVSMGDLF